MGTGFGWGSRSTRARTCSVATSSVSSTGFTRLASTGATQESRSKPSWATWLVGPSGHDGLSGGVAAGVVIVPPPWARLRVASSPHRDVHGVDRRIVWASVFERVPREQIPQPSFIDASLAQSGVEATPTAAVDGLKAQMRWRGDRTSG